MANLIIRDRGTRKSTALVYTSFVTRYPILVQYESRIQHLITIAIDLGVNIPRPIRIDQYRDSKRKEENVLIDEGYDLIGAAVDSYLGTHVAAITFTDKIKEGENQCR